ncbi:transcription elongation factor Spt5 [Candidatus Pacearchaeota archaeon]|nr:transcription elongation factor Spt5 [Candidatus Pacearchaeota archaeon]
MIFVVKVTTNKEDKVVEMVQERAESKKITIYSIMRPHGLRGYFFIEAPARSYVEEAVFDMPYVKGIVPKTVDYEEIKNLIEPTVTKVNIEQGDIVEMIAEPFKKEKARVIRIDKQKEEVVVMLLGATIPIPLTVKLDNVRVIRRDKEEKKEEFAE